MNTAFLANALRVALLSGAVGGALLLQEGVLAFAFGVTPDLVAFQIAFLWISLLWNVLAGGTLLATLVPAYIWARAHMSPADAGRGFTSLSAWLLLMCALISVVLAVAMPRVYQASGLAAAQAALAGALFIMMVPTIVFQALAAIAQARLNADGRFAMAAFTPVLPPLAASAATLGLSDRAGVAAAAYGVLAGQLLQTVVLVCTLRRRPDSRTAVVWSLGGLRDALPFLRTYWMLATAAAFLSGVFWVDQFIAARLGSESVARLTYAYRPVFLLHALATVAVANVALPAFTRYAAEGDRARLRAELRRVAVTVLVITAAVVPLWIVLAPEIVSLLYERGAFPAEETARVAAIQRWTLVQTPFYLLGVLSWRMLNALKQNTPIAAITAGCFIINLGITQPLASMMGEAGIMAATAAAFCVWAFLLLWVLGRRLKVLGTVK